MVWCGVWSISVQSLGEPAGESTAAVPSLPGTALTLTSPLLPLFPLLPLLLLLPGLAGGGETVRSVIGVRLSYCSSVVVL